MTPFVHDKLLPANCYSARALEPRGILTHHISAKYTNPADPYDPGVCWRILRDYHFSAHYMVLRTGDIWQLVPEMKQAWHAGKSRFLDMEGLNRWFFGVEFIGREEEAFEPVQYEAGADLYWWLMQRHEIPSDLITGHEIVSDERVRDDPKHDPGQYFDWVRFGHLILSRAA